MKLIIAGSRYMEDYDVVRRAVYSFAKTLYSTGIPLPLNTWISEIISGGAKGVDTLGEKFARENKIDLTIMEANWDRYGRAAGPRRNFRMAQYGTHLLAIPQSTTGGTQNMMDTMLTEKKPVFVYDMNASKGHYYVGKNT
jgi:hypothetical protein